MMNGNSMYLNSTGTSISEKKQAELFLLLRLIRSQNKNFKGKS